MRRLLVSQARFAITAAVVRLVAGSVFLAFGLGKFTDHASETQSFASYSLPSPSAFAYAIGALELGFGLLVLLGLLTRLAALGLAGNMVGAITAAGPVEGGVVNLGLAPALLVAMLFLVWAGAGRFALDERLAAPPRWSV